MSFFGESGTRILEAAQDHRAVSTPTTPRPPPTSPTSINAPSVLLAPGTPITYVWQGVGPRQHAIVTDAQKAIITATNKAFPEGGVYQVLRPRESLVTISEYFYGRDAQGFLLVDAESLTIEINSGGVQRIVPPAPTQCLTKGMRVVLPDMHTELRIGLRSASGGLQSVAVTDLYDVLEDLRAPRPDKKGAQEQVTFCCV